jgi:hypothetical protein
MWFCSVYAGDAMETKQKPFVKRLNGPPELHKRSFFKRLGTTALRGVIALTLSSPFLFHVAKGQDTAAQAISRPSAKADSVALQSNPAEISAGDTIGLNSDFRTAAKSMAKANAEFSADSEPNSQQYTMNTVAEDIAFQNGTSLAATVKRFGQDLTRIALLAGFDVDAINSVIQNWNQQYGLNLPKVATTKKMVK